MTGHIRFPTKYALTLGVLTLLVVPLLPSTSLSEAPAGCQAHLALRTIDGRPADEVLGPDGHVSSDVLRLDFESSFEGPDCPSLLNHPPELLGAWSSSDHTAATEEFAYTVTYVDVDGDAPTEIFATLDGGLSRPMQQIDPADHDYRDGADFQAVFGPTWINGTLLPEAMPGDHYALLRASDGRAWSDGARIEGPRIRNDPQGTLLAPNPGNRLVIHPIANGPMLRPPAEVLPPLGRVMGDAPEGVYSSLIAIDPALADIGTRWSIGQGAGFDLRGYGLLEGTPGPEGEFELLGSATTDAKAFTGSQSVDIAPEGASSGPDGTIGGIRIVPETILNLAHVGDVRARYATAAPQIQMRVRTIIEADADHDGHRDVCAVHEAPAASDPHWTEMGFGRDAPIRILADDCRTDVTPHDVQDGSTSLDDLQDQAWFGLARVLALRIEAVSAAPSTADLLIDNVVLAAGPAATNADIDVCFYPATTGPPDALQPLECVSDIGPHSGILPPGTRAASVWADQMVPVLAMESLAPRRPYLEPAGFGLHLRHSRDQGPGFQLPMPTTGRILLAHDLDRDAVLDEDEPVAAMIGDLPFSREAIQHSLTAPLGGPDDAYGLLLVHQLDRPGVGPAILSFEIQRFVNDAPRAGLGIDRHAHPKHTVTFLPEATDPDDAQSPTAQRLGGLASWRLSFGDGSPDASGTTMPDAIEHTYRRHGQYTAMLTVMDRQGETISIQQILSIGGHPRWSDDIE